MRYIGRVGEVELRIDREGGEQVIVLEWAAGATGGMGLVNVLAGGEQVRLIPAAGGKAMVARVMHTVTVDRQLVEVCEALTMIRYAHPRMVQLELAMVDEEQKAQLLRVYA